MHFESVMFDLLMWWAGGVFSGGPVEAWYVSLTSLSVNVPIDGVVGECCHVEAEVPA